MVILSRVGLDIWFGRIPNNETIRIPDIRLFLLPDIPLSVRISGNLSDIGTFSINDRISGIRNQLDIQYPAKKISGPTLILRDSFFSEQT